MAYPDRQADVAVSQTPEGTRLMDRAQEPDDPDRACNPSRKRHLATSAPDSPALAKRRWICPIQD
ncbi:MAG: hypothetical protein ACK55I_28385 [bacterium]